MYSIVEIYTCTLFNLTGKAPPSPSSCASSNSALGIAGMEVIRQRFGSTTSAVHRTMSTTSSVVNTTWAVSCHHRAAAHKLWPSRAVSE